jgi:nitroreductase
MIKKAESSVDLEANIAKRWSTRSFDEAYEVPDKDVIALLEAARWAASGSNVQPWRFLVAKHGTSEFAKITETLSGNNKVWAPKASLFIVALAQTHSSEGKERKLALYDVGLAVGQLGIQATALGLSLHQMAGFDGDALSSTLTISSDLKPLVVIAIGKYSADSSLPEELQEREQTPRTRKTLAEIVVSGLPKF